MAGYRPRRSPGRAGFVFIAVALLACVLGAWGGRSVRGDPFVFTGPYALDRTGSQQTFGGVSCPSASQCTAVDISGNEVTFDPASGTVNPAGSRPAPGGSPLNAVSCPAASQCTAVDDSGREVTFDPVSGAVNAAGTRRIDSRSLTSVSCPSIAQCTAVDDHGHEATFDPASGSVNATGIAKVDAVRVPDPSPSAYTTPAFSVACPSASQCTVVDFAGNEATFDPVSGTVNAAGAKSVGRGQKLELNAVACPSGSQCTAADDSGREVTFDPITGTVNAVGVRLVDTSPVDRSGFSGRFGPSLSCPAASQCITVDEAGNEMTFDPTSGAVNAARIEPRTAAHQYLGGVSCPPPGSQCTAVDGSGSEVTFDPASGVVNAAGIKPVGSGILNAVACPSSARCTAVDQGGDEVTFDPASGRPNHAGVEPIDARHELSSVACPSRSRCVAVDDRGYEVTFGLQSARGSASRPRPIDRGGTLFGWRARRSLNAPRSTSTPRLR